MRARSRCTRDKNTRANAARNIITGVLRRCGALWRSGRYVGSDFPRSAADEIVCGVADARVLLRRPIEASCFFSISLFNNAHDMMTRSRVDGLTLNSL